MIRYIWRTLDILILIFTFFLANLRAFIFWTLFPETSSFHSEAWLEIAWWVVILALVLIVLSRSGLMSDFISIWKKNYLLMGFLVFMVLSIFWSIAPMVSAYRVLELIITSVTGVYIGTRYDVKALLKILFGFGVFLVVISYIMAIDLPIMGRMFNPPYDGAWRGVYWHKNHLGEVMAFFNAVFLIYGIVSFSRRKVSVVGSCIFYLLTLGLVYLSDSAAGLILVILLHFAVLVSVLWLRFRERLKREHYYSISAIFIIGLTVAITNLKFIFGFFNRNPTLTGRVPLWTYLLEKVFPQHILFGTGYGAIWTQESFRLAVQRYLGWGYPVVMSDNGFFDMLLHLGIVGLLLFLSVLSIMLIRAYKYARLGSSLIDFLPLLIMWFILFANISYSLFMELESFFWLVMIIAVSQTTRSLFALSGQK